jgi:type III secretion protein N (ATPase)
VDRRADATEALPVEQLLDLLDRVPLRPWRGRLVEVCGLVARAVVPGCRVGELVRLYLDGDARSRGASPFVDAEVLGFRGPEATLMPLGRAEGLGPGTLAEPLGTSLTVSCGPALLGRILDGLGRPLDHRGPLNGDEARRVEGPPPAALGRQRVTCPLSTGLRVLDALTTFGEGQRLGLFAGAGVGKSTLLGQLARQCDADVAVLALVGERGREVREFIEDSLGPRGLARSVVVCATSDASAIERLHAANVATTVAEYFRDRGQRVLLLVDSLTRWARARREIGLAAGEPPARQGFPPSVFAELPRLLERTGPGDGRGSITAVYSVLVQGGELDDPVADELRGLLDGHILLDRGLAERGRFPAVDPVASLSRLADRLVSPEVRQAARTIRARLAAYEERRDLVVLGAYVRGSDVATDRAIDQHPELERFLCQPPDEHGALEDTHQRLLALARA